MESREAWGGGGGGGGADRGASLLGVRSTGPWSVLVGGSGGAGKR